MGSPNDIDDSRLKELQITFSDRVHEAAGVEEPYEAAEDPNVSGIAEHKDDKLTQS